MDEMAAWDAQIKPWLQVNWKIATTNDPIVSKPSNCTWSPQNERHPHDYELDGLTDF